MGLAFPSPLVLAAGLDRHGALLQHGAALGLGAVETGSHWTPGGQPAPMSRPRTSRRTAAGQSGMRPECTAAARPLPLHGLSLVKPPALDWPRAGEAIRHAIAAWHRGADYVVLNPGRGCPSAELFADLVAALAAWRERLPRPTPLALVVKLPASWVEADRRIELARRFVGAGADGLLLSAEGAIATASVRISQLADALGPSTSLMSVGGIDSVPVARARLRAGASLLHVHRAALGSERRVRSLLCELAALRPMPKSIG